MPWYALVKEAWPKGCESSRRKEENDNNTVDHTRRYDTNRPPTSLHNKPSTLMEFQDIYIVFNIGGINARVCSRQGSLTKGCEIVSRKEQNDNDTVDHMRRYDTNRPPTSLHNKPFTLVEFQDS